MRTTLLYMYKCWILYFEIVHGYNISMKMKNDFTLDIHNFTLIHFIHSCYWQIQSHHQYFFSEFKFVSVFDPLHVSCFLAFSGESNTGEHLTF